MYNKVSNVHTHYINGIKIQHSHPLSSHKNHHSHSNLELSFISLLNGFFIDEIIDNNLPSIIGANYFYIIEDDFQTLVSENYRLNNKSPPFC